jgi:hypothetical protein
MMITRFPNGRLFALMVDETGALMYGRDHFGISSEVSDSRGDCDKRKRPGRINELGGGFPAVGQDLDSRGDRAEDLGNGS